MRRYSLLFLIIFGLFLHHDDGKAMEQVAVLREMNATTIGFMAGVGVTCLGVGALGTYLFLNKKNSSVPAIGKKVGIEAISKIDEGRANFNMEVQKINEEHEQMIKDLNKQIEIQEKERKDLLEQISSQQKIGFKHGEEAEKSKYQEYFNGLLMMDKRDEHNLLPAIINHIEHSKEGDTMQPELIIKGVFEILKSSPALYQDDVKHTLRFR